MPDIGGSRLEEPKEGVPWLIAFAAGLYVLLCVSIFLMIRKVNDGHFVYSLDDPYIHLALAEQIARGHYGINPGQAASPSSSLLWPFLLAPFSRASWQVYVPLGLNFLAGLITAGLLGWNVATWPGRRHGAEEWVRRTLSAGALVLIGNLAGLTFVGMEHTLQVLFAVCCAMGIIGCLQGRTVPNWCLVVAALGPMVRYENVGLSVALAIALVGQKQWKRMTVMMTASLVPLVAFSLFLRHLGLPMLPCSILVKAGQSGQLQGPVHHLLNAMAASWSARSARGLLTMMFLTLAGLVCFERDRVRRFALAGAASAAGLHLLVGTFGWFHRYEVYIELFSALVVLYVLHERPREMLGWYVLGLLYCTTTSINILRDTSTSAHDVYLQQYQMHRFATDFYHAGTGRAANVAVNDIGLVSYRRRPGQEAIDLYGLASVEAEQQKNKSTAWLDSFTRAHDVGLVMIYQEWFAPPPSGWTELGKVCLINPPIQLAGDCVTYYATTLAPVSMLRAEFSAFAKTQPAGVRVLF